MGDFCEHPSIVAIIHAMRFVDADDLHFVGSILALNGLKPHAKIGSKFYSINRARERIVVWRQAGIGNVKLIIKAGNSFAGILMRP